MTSSAYLTCTCIGNSQCISVLNAVLPFVITVYLMWPNTP